MIYDTSGTLGKDITALSPAEVENLVLALIASGKLHGAIFNGKLIEIDNENEDTEETEA